MITIPAGDCDKIIPDKIPADIITSSGRCVKSNYVIKYVLRRGRRCVNLLKAVTGITKTKKYIKQFFQRADIFLLIMCIICSIYGIYSIDIAVTRMSAGGWDMFAPSKYIAVQTFSLFLGIAGFVVFTVIDADILGQQ